MSEQTEAQRLAEDLQLNRQYCPDEIYLQAAAELRRLEAANSELLETLYRLAYIRTNMEFRL